MGHLILPLILVLAFVAVATLAQTLGGAYLESRAKSQRVNRRLTLLESGMDQRQVYETLIRQRAAPKIENARLLAAYLRASRYMAQGGLRISPLVLIGIWWAVAVAIWLLATTGARAFGAVVGLPEMITSLVAALTLTGAATWIWVSGKRRTRLRRLEEQLPLALDIAIRSLRAGHPVVSALQLVTTEMPDPIGSEFGLMVDETTYGFELKEALANFARRTGSEDAHFFAVSVAIQTETGGNLAEILENLSRVIRARITLGKRVKALSSEGRMSAVILSVLPLFLIATISMTQPTFYTSKFSDPIFWPTVAVVLCVYFVGLMIMNRIINFKY